MNFEKKSSMEIRKINRNIIYRLIYKSKKTSKQEIANRLEMSLPTVTQNLKILKEEGLIMEDGEFESTGGRKAKAIICIKDSKVSLGIDITKNHISIVSVDLMGNIIKSNRVFKKFKNTDCYFKELNEILENFVEDSKINREKILGVGISVPGILSNDKRYVLYSHALELSNMECKNFDEFISYSCVISNDANAASIAETWNLDDINNIVYISLSNTVGGAILLNNKIYEGGNQRSGEIGHMTIIPDGKWCYCGKKGCVDAYSSALCLSNHTNGNLEEFFNILNKDNNKIKKVWDDYLNYLSIVINNLRMLFDCNVILGGYVGAYMEKYFNDLKELVNNRNAFERESDFLRVCRYKKESSAVGAALIHIDKFINSI